MSRGRASSSASHFFIVQDETGGMTKPEDVIVGKSVEEIENESGNRVNSAVEGEARRDTGGTVLTPINPAGAGVMGAGVVGAGVVGAGAGGAGSTGAGGAGAGTGALGGLPGVFGTEAGRDATDADDRRGDRDNGSSEE
jgi:hypothetical protein